MSDNSNDYFIFATGALNLTSAGIYDLYCDFIKGEKTNFINLSSVGIGLTVGELLTGMIGGFYVDPWEYRGPCKFSLYGAGFEDTALTLEIYDKEGKKLLGSFAAAGIGAGFSALHMKHGHLHIPRKEHDNRVLFLGHTTPIQSVMLNFHTDNVVYPSDQPYDGIQIYYDGATKNKMVIDVICGRSNKYGQKAASFFNEGIGKNPDHFICAVKHDLQSTVNFAFNGKLIFNAIEMEVYIAQSSYGSTNYWMLGSKDLVMKSNSFGRMATINGVEIAALDNETFSILQNL